MAIPRKLSANSKQFDGRIQNSFTIYNEVDKGKKRFSFCFLQDFTILATESLLLLPISSFFFLLHAISNGS
ncbi:hypothetical protein A4A49_58265 [Nicotiana attenuata]|uniref:Uncharacterized protein n=1 Tax=Nicotiana attenuata TaxID=49451 RepID=A0A314KNG2_NICAT|nr:hypothetical protein A4A49_58265 [Nicotiana attenuata]